MARAPEVNCDRALREEMLERFVRMGTRVGAPGSNVSGTKGRPGLSAIAAVA